MTRKLTSAYVLMLAGTASLLYGIIQLGTSCIAVTPQIHQSQTHAPAPTNATLLHILLALTAVLLTTRCFGVLASLVKQPAVIGEIIGGIILGPTALGTFAPDITAYLFPPTTMPVLFIIAQLGVLLFMFIIGLELDLDEVRHSSHGVLAISHTSIVVPFLLGATLAIPLYTPLAVPGTPFLSFCLFIGVSLSITALPVLARILEEKGLTHSMLGRMAITCAAVDDATAWCLLAFVVAACTGNVHDAIVTLTLTAAYIPTMLYGIGPALRAFTQRYEQRASIGPMSYTVIFSALLVSAIAAEVIGIHALFGAFLLGAVIPSHSAVAVHLRERLHDTVHVLFLPCFFAFSGLRTSMQSLAGLEDWLWCALIIALAVLGKWGGTVIAARFVGIQKREASQLGILMNTRGLVELIVLNIGLDLGILSQRLFAMLVIMALVTTAMTAPLLEFSRRKPV